MKLDVGCGEQKRGDIGVDVRRTGAIDVLADTHFLPFKSEVFDQVVSVTLLEHCLNPFNALKEQARVLKKDGKLYCETDNAYYWRYHTWIADHPRHRIKSDYNPSDTHYMIFYPMNVAKMFKMLHLSNIQSRFIERRCKLDKVIGIFKPFKRNTYGRFSVEGIK